MLIYLARRLALIKDDPVRQSNKRGFVTYATSGPHARNTQVFSDVYVSYPRRDTL